MSNLFLTLIIAFVIIIIAIACLAIGWLITGKTKITRGACGKDLLKKQDESCKATSACDGGLRSDLFEEQNVLHRGTDKDEKITKI